MEGVVAAQLHKPRVPGHDLSFAAGNGRAQVVVDQLAWNAAKPLEGAHVALEERLDGHVEAEVRGRGAREGSEQINA